MANFFDCKNKIKISREKISSFACNVLPIWLTGEEDLRSRDIKWTAFGGVHIRGFSEEAHGMNHAVLVTLDEEGSARVTAELDGERYSTEITVYKTKSSEGLKPNYYTADLHNHTTKVHGYDNLHLRNGDFQRDYVEYIKKCDDIDLSVISDHASQVDPMEFFTCFSESELAEPLNTVILPGCESEIEYVESDRFGLKHKNSGEIVTLNADNYAYALSYDDFFKKMETSPFAIGILAHPQGIGYIVLGVWNFSLDKHRDDGLSNIIKLVEIGNGIATCESNLVNEFVYSVALDEGFKVSTVCSSDSHSAPWGALAMPGKTIIMAEEKSKEAFVDALRNCRCYASESGNVKLYCEVNGKPIPCELPLTNQYHFHIEIDYFREECDSVPVKCELISDYGKTLCTFGAEDYSSFDFDVESNSARWFYLRFCDKLNRKTLSPPIFCGRAIDKQEELASPIDKRNASAHDTVSGLDLQCLLNENPKDDWQSDFNTADILIDLHGKCKISALGYYPPYITRQNCADIVSAFASCACEYEVFSSLDGESFEKIADGLVRTYGGEHVIRFPEVEAGYLRFVVKSTVGDYFGRSELSHGVRIAELTPFGEKIKER